MDLETKGKKKEKKIEPKDKNIIIFFFSLKEKIQACFNFSKN
jgi:hypothetical protein